MQVQGCVREEKTPLHKLFDYAEALGRVMQADLAPVSSWADAHVADFKGQDRPVPDYLSHFTPAEMQQRDKY